MKIFLYIVNDAEQTALPMKKSAPTFEYCVFVCLRFYGLINTIKVMPSRSVTLHCPWAGLRGRVSNNLNNP